MEHLYQSSDPSDVQRLAELVKEIKFVMFVTESETEGLRSRPMTLQEAEFDGDFWFFTAHDSPLVRDVREHPRVNLAFASPKNQTYISACGRAQVSFDRPKMEQLWSPLYHAWFPQGLQDPKLCLVRVRVEKADYWESPSSKVVQLMGFAKAALTGRPLREQEAGRHGHVDLGRTG